jgi:hypothetical protein
MEKTDANAHRFVDSFRDCFFVLQLASSMRLAGGIALSDPRRIDAGELILIDELHTSGKCNVGSKESQSYLALPSITVWFLPMVIFLA